ncbi:hypothetical protein F5Y18DRAFT_249380 [Xylariaceae sp. FL1019]|nr:hypothetical protein F5Y18DRAFT_249380 [Xylariaceae sp. FL1019]
MAENGSMLLANSERVSISCSASYSMAPVFQLEPLSVGPNSCFSSGTSTLLRRRSWNLRLCRYHRSNCSVAQAPKPGAETSLTGPRLATFSQSRISAHTSHSLESPIQQPVQRQGSLPYSGSQQRNEHCMRVYLLNQPRKTLWLSPALTTKRRRPVTHSSRAVEGCTHSSPAKLRCVLLTYGSSLLLTAMLAFRCPIPATPAARRLPTGDGSPYDQFTHITLTAVPSFPSPIAISTNTTPICNTDDLVLS